jgi:uncharacterized Zn-finger protein
METDGGEKQKSTSKKHSCKICGNSFPHISNLILHERIHTGVKPFECDICGKFFNQNYNLVKHKRRHTGEKPYACDLCKKIFADNSTLVQHKMIHTGERPFKCDICEKTFVRSNNLADHKRIHTGEKPFSCDICQKSFNSSSHLSKHNKTTTHLERKEFQNIYIASTQASFVDFGENIKLDDIKKEIKEEDIVGDPFSLSYCTVKQEIKEEIQDCNEDQGVQDSIGTDQHLVDCSQYVKIEMNLTE